jgi:hypothetical protein
MGVQWQRISHQTVMNAPIHPEVLLSKQPGDQPPLPLATEGVQRYIWQSAYGQMLIEVNGWRGVCERWARGLHR